MSELLEVYKQYNGRQEKYTYYIIALAVTAIGYSVHLTHGESLNETHIILGISITAWMGSVFCGLGLIKNSMIVIQINLHEIAVKKGLKSLYGIELERVGNEFFEAKRVSQKANNKVANFYKWQYLLFCAGALTFIMWHLTEMYLTTT